MHISDGEYILLRIVRKFLVKERILARLKGVIPYYRSSQNEISPVPVVDLYWRLCMEKNIVPVGKRILEIGSGATNSVGYEIASRGGHYIGYEPFVALDAKEDKRLYETRIAGRFAHLETCRVSRITRLDRLDSQSVDLVFSHSVLEHVADLDGLLAELARVLRKNGWMFHVVDYRDHFFKYPFHFLKFSERTWNRLLNPGDLTRARIDDHLKAFEKRAFRAEVLHRRIDAKSFAAVRDHLHQDFRRHADEDLATVWAVLSAGAGSG